MLIATVEGREVTRREVVSMESRHPLSRINWLSRQGVDVVICGGISGFSLRLLSDLGLRVLPGVNGDLEETIRLFLEDRLQPGPIAGPGGKGQRCRRRGGRRGEKGPRG
jgi:predicted Fe-Mo cluster-binding NifX family protein